MEITEVTEIEADAVRRLTAVSQQRTLRLGELKLSYVLDGAVRLKPRGWFPGTADQDWETNRRYLDPDGSLVGSIGGLLVEHGGRALLIDAGVGPQSAPADPDNPVMGEIHGGTFPDSLARLGRTPDQVEAIAITHLHGDHVGWAAQPAFAGAEVLLTATEWEHRGAAAQHGVTAEMVGALTPRVRMVEQGEEIFPGVRVLATPGHTPGHAAFEITSVGAGAGDEAGAGDGSEVQRLIAFGDALHSPVQVRHPEWTVVADADSEQAERTRRQLLEELATPGTVGFGVHFADVVFGRVGRDSEGFGWVPER
ncbi:MBL fold metallo-hydrolase [Streptomyces sp. H27-D2]|uniref:MBL fold metallo-hydrolase n=1 Tax=Streptomyces sp. H27-D2 TaxID=3046304 RepID=UPI002DBD58FC|nr:MBL fold metallo-hydrolase [Streptomyces sp. H27-D2]MEC4020276.1 MBL fold metallo-hydrolase [Streptomyces sp. H27-D2]